MFSKLFNILQLLRENLWFWPALTCFISASMTLVLYGVEVRYLTDLQIYDVFFKGDTREAQAITVSLLSAMITMATLAISITIIVISLAASQFGPRLIRSFMADKRTKLYIGLFFGTVVSTFILTFILHSAQTENFTPRITVTFVYVTCLANLFILLGYVHHVAKSCIADNIILKVSSDLNAAARRITREVKDDDEKKKKNHWPKNFEDDKTALHINKSGYVQYIDYDFLADAAQKYNGHITVDFSAGTYIVNNQNGVHYAFKDKKDEDDKDIVKELCSGFVMGKERTSTQDIEYSIRHLEEIAIRALSPGINDSFTAVRVLDNLTQFLAIFISRDLPASKFYDDEGKLRVKAARWQYSDIIFSAFDQIRYNGKSMPSMVGHMLDKLGTLAEVVTKKDAVKGLKVQVQAIEDSLLEIKPYASNYDQLGEKIKTIKKMLKDKS